MGIADEFMKGFLEKHREASSGKYSFDELNILLKQYQQQQNGVSIGDFDGLSPEQMHLLLHFDLIRSSVLPLNEKCPDEIIDQVPLFALSELLLNHILLTGKIKLTSKGNLPVAVCQLLYDSSGLDFRYKKFIKKITEETIPYIWPVKDYLLFEGLIKKRNNWLSITQKGTKYLVKNKTDRLVQLLLYFTQRINWINFYHNDEDVTGKLGWAYSLYLLKKYGYEYRSSDFYSMELIRAFGYQPLNDVSDFQAAYNIRFFDIFCNWFGFAEIKRNFNRSTYKDNYDVRKSAVLDLLFASSI